MSEDINPSSMKMTDMLMTINGTPYGEVLNENSVRRFRGTGGNRFFNNTKKTYNLLQFIAWAFEKKHTTPLSIGQTYEEKKAKAAERSAKQSRSGREIGPLPERKDPKLREDCRFNFKLFCEKLFPETFSKAWSKDHLDAIAKIEDATLRGALFALAMPRGSGKTSLVEIAVIWALLYGHRQFVMLIGSIDEAAVKMLDSIKFEFENNDLLYDLFPEVCHPIRALDGTMQKANSQLLDDKRTEITWKGDEIVLPKVEGSQCSGSIINVAGITGNIRGRKIKSPTGKPLRPDLVILDDPQTDESAKSVKQNGDRLETITGAVLGLAGPGEKIAGFMPCTVIKPGDMVDTILNKKLYPQWRGQRTQMVVKFPDNMKLWEEYETIYGQSFEEHGDFRNATEFYKKNREEMDAGAVVSWEARFNHDEISALQNAMNIKIDDEYAFWAEYQNDPKDRAMEGVVMITANEICEKKNGLPRFEIPVECDYITVGIDVQKKALYYVVMAWESNGTCYLIDYGTFPDQRSHYFTLDEIKKTYLDKSTGGYESDLYKALQEMVPAIMNREFVRNDGVIMKVDQMLIDANWEKSKDTIYKYCRASPFGNNVFPSHGRYYGAAKKPMSESPRKKGEKRGLNWILTYPKTAQTVRYIYFDANFWKSFVHERLNTDMGGRGCLSLFGKDTRPLRMFADHMVAEFYIQTEGRDRKLDEWTLRVGQKENHFFDGAILCSVGASMRGVAIEKRRTAPKPKEKSKRKMSDEIAARRKGS